MSVRFRPIAITAGIATAIALGLAAPAIFPAAFADEPQSHLLDTARDIFPPAFDLDQLKKFDITYDSSVSTKVQHTDVVGKIGFGRRSSVAIVTTPSGTYSSDALVSPNVRYPGIQVTPRDSERSFAFSYFGSPAGTGSWTRLDRGSFTYLTYSFTPAARAQI